MGRAALPSPGLSMQTSLCEALPSATPEEPSAAQPQYISALRRSAAAILASSHASASGAAPRQTAFDILSQWYSAHLADEAALELWTQQQERIISAHGPGPGTAASPGPPAARAPAPREMRE
eukprot:7215954-Heterocapsa_arctica.AAC.1